MLTHACKLLIPLSLLLFGACDIKPELVGATLPDAGAEGASDTGDASDPSSDGEPTTAAPDGAPCELGPSEVYEEGSMVPEPGAPVEYGAGPIVTPGPACAGEVCLYAAHVDPPNCTDDAACGGDERLSGSCGEFQCEVAPAWGEAHTTCTRLCEVDTDCPAVPGCVEGPVCTPISRIGSLCCKQVCACRDELSEEGLAEIAFACNSGMFCQ